MVVDFNVRGLAKGGASWSGGSSNYRPEQPRKSVADRDERSIERKLSTEPPDLPDITGDQSVN